MLFDNEAVMFAAAGGGSTLDVLDIFGDGNSLFLHQFNNDATDVGGTYDGTPTNITYVPGVFDNQADFDGTTSSIRVVNETALDKTNIWWSGHISTDTIGAVQTAYGHRLRSAGSGDVWNGGFRVGFRDTGKIFLQFNVLNNESYSSNIFASANTYGIQIGTSWAASVSTTYHVVIHINGTTASIWVDGTLAETITISQSFRYSSDTFRDAVNYGAFYYPDTTTYYNRLDGQVDQSRLGYNRAISAADLTLLRYETAA